MSAQKLKVLGSVRLITTKKKKKKKDKNDLYEMTIYIVHGFSRDTLNNSVPFSLTASCFLIGCPGMKQHFLCTE